MIGLDTNVLVRLLAADDDEQLARATALLAAHDGQAAAFHVNDIVLVELVWVLRRLYGYERGQVVIAVQALLDNDAFAFDNRDRIDDALALCRDQANDLADALIALKNVEAGCTETASFDKSTRNLPAVRVL